MSPWSVSTDKGHTARSATARSTSTLSKQTGQTTCTHSCTRQIVLHSPQTDSTSCRPAGTNCVLLSVRFVLQQQQIKTLKSNSNMKFGIVWKCAAVLAFVGNLSEVLHRLRVLPLVCGCVDALLLVHPLCGGESSLCIMSFSECLREGSRRLYVGFCRWPGSNRLRISGAPSGLLVRCRCQCL